MMRPDKINNLFRQTGFLRNLHTFRHMTDDPLRTLDVRQSVMRIDSILVLGKIKRIAHLSDIMIHGTCTYQLRIRANLSRGLRGDNRHLQRMLESSGASLAQPFQYAAIDIRQFHQSNGRQITKCFLQHIYQNIRKHQQDKINTEIKHHDPMNLIQVRILIQNQAEIRQGIRQEYKQGTMH